MGDYGRIQALIIATVKGHVVYERFYSTFTDLERAEMRAALQVTGAPHGRCHPWHALLMGGAASACSEPAPQSSATAHPRHIYSKQQQRRALS
jgi:hypothetical protein